MPRRRNPGPSESPGGRLGVLRKEVQRVLEGLRREIATRESELAQLRSEYEGAAQLFGATPPTAASAPARAARPRPARRAKALDWKQVYGSLPARFTLGDLERHPSAGKRSKAHLYAIVSRWKKEKKITKDAKGGYRKAGEAAAKAKPAAKPKPKPALKPSPSKNATPRPETPPA